MTTPGEPHPPDSRSEPIYTEVAMTDADRDARVREDFIRSTRTMTVTSLLAS
jgi:hypothetical protein